MSLAELLALIWLGSVAASAFIWTLACIMLSVCGDPINRTTKIQIVFLILMWPLFMVGWILYFLGGSLISFCGWVLDVMTAWLDR